MAKRVTESIRQRTSWSSSRKYSATASVRYAACRRIKAGSSEVATTTTERASPSSPRSSCKNSCTSRPRSPIRPITLISASTLRASIESSTDLPTPELARMCRRRRIAERHWRGALRQRPLAVDRLAQRVDDAAEPGRRRTHLIGRIGDNRLAAAAHTVEAGERHHDGIVPGEADHLAGDRTVRAGLDHEPCADRHRVYRAGHFDHQAANADHTAINIDAVDVADLFGKSLHNKRAFIRGVPSS